MVKDLRDAKRAFGLSFSLALYGAWLVFDWWMRRDKESQALRAKLIHDNASAKRERIMIEEGLDVE